MGNFNGSKSVEVQVKQWLAIFLLAIPMVGHAVGMIGLVNTFVGKLPSNVILNLLSALGFFLLWRIASNVATRVAARIATVMYALWTIYFALLELVGFETMPAWAIYVVATMQIVAPLVLAYTASLVGENNRLGILAKCAVWIVSVMCIFESYWAVANSPVSLCLFDGMAANNISVSALREVYRWFVVVLDVLAVAAFAILCTSSAFDGDRNPNEPEPKYTPINRYMATTVIVTLVLIALS